MSVPGDLSGLVAAVVAAILSVLGVPGARPIAPRPAMTSPALPQPTAPSPALRAPAVPGPTLAKPPPGAITIKRDGASLSFARQNRPHGNSLIGDRPTGSQAAAASAGSRLDIDHDGLDEVVMGAFTAGGYGLVVLYSSLPYIDIVSSPITSPTRPNFGDVLTSGDFNGDGYADLAVSNQGEFVAGSTSGSDAFAGAVWIFYGSATGLNPATVQHINQNVDGVPDDMEAYDMFGAGIAAGDLNGDGYDEIAIGAPGESLGPFPYAGSATVLFGSPTGLTTTGVVAITEDSPGVPDEVEPYDAFGRGVAIGDMTGDGYADLAVGSPGENDNIACLCELGMVVLIPGGASGLSSTGISALHGATAEVAVSTLGENLVMADINRDGKDDLIAATPRSSGGWITYIPGAAAGLSANGVRVINEDTPGVPSDAQCCQVDGNGEWFGYSVATGDVTGDGYPDVLVGNIGQDVNGAVDAGSATLIPGSAAGLTGAGSVMITQGGGRVQPAGSKPVPGAQYRDVAESYDYFGTSGAIVNLDGVGPAELLVATDREANAGEPSYAGTGFLMALRYEGTPARRGSTGTGGMLVPMVSLPGSVFGVYFMGSSLLHS
jgi:hypothetical protein